MTARASASGASLPPSPRIPSIDLLRGLVMLLMAIDHVRVFSGVPAGGPTFGVFFTRWITHFCAPAFVFLAGTSAWFYGRRHPDLSRFLVTRGLWLVVLELTVIRVGWTFNFDFAHYLLAGVIWVIGWSMVALAVLVRLPVGLVGAFGVAMIAGHNLLDGTVRQLAPNLGNDLGASLWKIAYVGPFAGPVSGGPDGPHLFILYSLVPWVGVMAAGYAFARVLALEPGRRDRACLAIGLGMIALFVILRGFNLYGDPRPWSAPAPDGFGPTMPTLLSFLNTTKYPASLLFLLMTLGPSIAAIPLLERWRGAAADVVALFGRVPFFFYVLHIPLIHALALGVSVVRTGAVTPWLFANHPMEAGPAPEGYVWGLGVVYGVWAVACVLLYFACRWWVGRKARGTAWVWKYL